MNNYILNTVKSPKCSNYKIEIIFGAEKGQILKLNKTHFKELKGHNIKRINEYTLILQSYNFDDDIKNLINDLNTIYCTKNLIKEIEYSYLINWSKI